MNNVKLSGLTAICLVLAFLLMAKSCELEHANNIAEKNPARYILVQLPEPLDPDNNDQKTAVKFCDKLGKPRTIASASTMP